jgi:hypothetical protein
VKEGGGGGNSSISEDTADTTSSASRITHFSPAMEILSTLPSESSVKTKNGNIGQLGAHIRLSTFSAVYKTPKMRLVYHTIEILHTD